MQDEDLRPKRAAPGQVPDISQFLDDNKGRVDRDPDGLAYDDLRHYAYEGDGNSMGSLSSLASGSLEVFQETFYQETVILTVYLFEYF